MVCSKTLQWATLGTQFLNPGYNPDLEFKKKIPINSNFTMADLHGKLALNTLATSSERLGAEMATYPFLNLNQV